jgi:hypothetical protein
MRHNKSEAQGNNAFWAPQLVAISTLSTNPATTAWLLSLAKTEEKRAMKALK